MELIHAIPGRVRVRLPEIKADAERARQIEQMLGSLPAVRQAQANPLTASVLIHYNCDQLAELLENTPDEQLSGWAARLGLEPAQLRRWVTDGDRFGAACGSPPDLETAIRAGARALDERVGRTTGVINLRLLVPVVLFGLGLRALLARGNLAVPAWYDYFWFALGTFFMLNPGSRPESGPREAESRQVVLA
jgi:hypothetical protein